MFLRNVSDFPSSRVLKHFKLRKKGRELCYIYVGGQFLNCVWYLFINAKTKMNTFFVGVKGPVSYINKCDAAILI